MKRDASQLRDHTYDVVVVGGGIYGAWTAYDAALRGLFVAIIDKGDWACGTSSASTKLIHGGLRYLEQFRFGLVRHSLRERQRLLQLAPHRVKPLRFIIPDYADNRVSRWKLRAGLAVYDLLAGEGGSGAVSRAEMAAKHGFLSEDGLRGGLAYADCAMDDARFVVEIIDGAVSAGAHAVNYVEAAGLLQSNSGIHGVQARDTVSGEEFEIRSQMVVNTAGPWAATLDPAGPQPRLVKGVHLVMPALPSDNAYLFMTRGDGRVFFLVPSYRRTLLGTTDTNFEGDADSVNVTQADVDYLLHEVARYLGDRTWAESDIVGRFAGVRALQDGDNESASQTTREWRLDEPHKGLLVSLGGKYTSARADAAELVDRVLQNMGRSTGTSPTESLPFPWRPQPSFEAWERDVIERLEGAGVDEMSARTLSQRYGSRIESVLQLVLNDASLGKRIVSDLPFVTAELIVAARDEMSVTLEDVVRRRLPLAILHQLDAAALAEIATQTTPYLPKSPASLDAQIAEVLQRWTAGLRI